jgi:prepilin-type processing-associated H-X9-DG protein
LYIDLCGRRDFPPASGTEHDHHRSSVLCPSDAGAETNRFYAGYSTSNYLAVHGGGIRAVNDDLDNPGNGVFGEASSVTMEHITDGAGNAFLVGERSLTSTGNAGAIWMRSINEFGDGDNGSAVAGICDRSAMINDFTNPDVFSSSHVGGAHFAMADGSVRFVNESIQAKVYERLTTIDDDN